MSEKTLAARTVTGVVAGMVTVTAAATAVGFWLSYGGLHEFAIRSGLAGAEAWAWPASVDLFIAAGEAGVTISALRSQRDRGAWLYLGLGLVASVTGNVLHVHPGHLAWTPYAVAAVPPLAAMLALAALLRHVYRLAVERHDTATKTASTETTARATAKPPAKAIRKPAGRGTEAAAEATRKAIAAGQPAPSARALAREHHIGRETASRVRTSVLAGADGHPSAHPGALTAKEI